MHEKNLKFTVKILFIYLTNNLHFSLVTVRYYFGGGSKVALAFSIFWSFMKRFWCGLKQKSILKLEHHLFLDLNFEKNDRVVIREVMTTALKFHHYSIIKFIQRALKGYKDVWNTKILNIFKAWKQKIVVKTNFVVIFQIYVVMTTSCLFFVLYTYIHIKIYIFLVRKPQKWNIFDIWPLFTL